MTKLEMYIPAAVDFFVVLATGLAVALVVDDSEVRVELTTPVLVMFWNRICGASSASLEEEVLELFALPVGLSEKEVMVELELVFEVVVGVALELDCVEVGATVDEALVEEPLDAELLPPTGKTTMSAVPPDGTVTTQKSAPPAPLASSGLVTPPMPTTEGLMEHGRPLHPDPEHSISRPNVGDVPPKFELVQIGFQPILT